jgi:glycosyltransferase involved in cell wall biosynthesis
MMTSPVSALISIIIPAYNAGHFIAQTLISIQAQSYPSWEAIVIDDQSDDETAAIVQGFAASDSRIHYHCLPQKAGRPSVNRNVGMKLAKGDFITFMDADDVYYPNGLQTLLTPLLQDAGLNASMAFPYYCDNELNPLHPPVQLQENSPGRFNFTPGYQLSWEGLCHRRQALFVCCTMIRSQVLTQMLPMDEALLTAEDFKFLIGLMRLGTKRIAMLPTCTYQYRNYAGSLTKSPQSLLKTIDSDVRVTRWLFELPELPQHLRRTRNYHLTHRLVVTISTLIRMGERTLALKAFCGALAQREVYSPVGLKYLSKEALRLLLPKRSDGGYFASAQARQTQQKDSVA